MGVQENTGKQCSQIIAVLLACLTQLSGGILFAWPSPSIPILTSDEHHLNITTEEASYLAFIPSISTILFSFPAAKLIDIEGRKLVLLVIASIQIMVWFLILVHNSIWWLYASRFINGIAEACIYAALPAYIGEICTPEIRGTMGNAISFVMYIGMVSINVIGSYCSITTTAYIFVCIPIIFIPCFNCMPESPYYLVANGKVEKARSALKWLRQKENVEDELSVISKAMERQFSQQSTLKDLFVQEHRKAIIIGVLLRFLLDFSGVSAFQTYGQNIFKEVKSDISVNTMAIMFTVVQAIFGTIASLFVDKLGRRKTIQLSAAGCIISLFATGLYLQLQVTTFTWFPLAGTTLFIVCYSLGLGMVPILMMAELFASYVKANALGVMNIAFGVFELGSIIIFQQIMSGVSLYASLYFFGACTLLGTIACYFLVPETKGKTLEEIQLELKGSLTPTICKN